MQQQVVAIAETFVETFAAKLAAREIFDKKRKQQRRRMGKKKVERRQICGPKLTAGQEQRLKRAKVISAPPTPPYTHKVLCAASLTHCFG